VYQCPSCEGAGFLDVVYDYDFIARRWSREDLPSNRETAMWRYLPLLPVDPGTERPPLAVGGTPLYSVPRLASEARIAALWVKDDSRQPTASLKDRASALAVVKARELGYRTIATASTGNAAAALSGLSASIGLDAVVLVPRTAPPAKLAQLVAFGARVVLVDGTYDEAFDLCGAACHRFGWYNRSTGVNPYMTEGKKTVAYEICEQLRWNPPDWIFVPVGDGCILGAVHKGLLDLRRLGWIHRIPRLMGVQAEGSDFLFRAWAAGGDTEAQPPVDARTVADSIHVALPRDRAKAMKAVVETGGGFVRVSDSEVVRAISVLARASGVFAEPAAGAALAGVAACAAEGSLLAHESVVVLVTGSGLKDVAPLVAAAREHPLPCVRPGADALDALGALTA
jgi:threonine synthase